MKVYKVALYDKEGNYTSVCARGSLKCTYRIGKTTRVPPIGREYKCYLTAFRTLKQAKGYRETILCPTVILLCEAPKPMKDASVHRAFGSSDSPFTGKIRVTSPNLRCLETFWPIGTLQFDRLTPQEVL